MWNIITPERHKEEPYSAAMKGDQCRWLERDQSSDEERREGERWRRQAVAVSSQIQIILESATEQTGWTAWQPGISHLDTGDLHHVT